MPFDSAFTSGQLESLRGTASVAKSFRAAQYLSVCPSDNVYTGRINQATIQAPVPELITDGGSGTLANVRAGMRVLFSHTSDRDDYYFETIVREGVTATLLKINPAGGVGFADNDYYFIVNDFPAETIYPRSIQDVPVPGWDLAWRKLRPIIKDIPPVSVGYVASGNLSFAYAPTVQAAADGATISTYLWEVPAGITFSSGSSSTKDVTLQVVSGDSYWVHFTATDSNGVASTFHIHIWAHNDAYPPELLEIGSWELEASIPIDPLQGAGSGFNGSIAAFDGADTLLDRTLICIWQRAYYNETLTNIGSSGNVLFSGRFRDEDNSMGYDDLSGQQDGVIRFGLEGVLAQLIQRFPPIEILDDANPDNWNQVKDLTLWRAIRLCADEYSTVTSVYPLGFDSIAETYRVPGRVTQGGDLLNSLSDLAMQINAVVQANGLGEVEVARRGNMVDSAARNAMPTIIDLDKRDYHRIISLTRDYTQQVGVLFGDGGSFNTSTGESSAFDVQAPSGQPGIGAADGQLPRQVLASDSSEDVQRTELTTRAGHGLAAQQTPVVLRVLMANGYHGLTPAVDQWYTWTLGADETVSGRIYTTATRWWLRSIRLTGDPERGEIEAECEFVRETSGQAGEIIDHPILDLGEFPGDLGELIDFPDLPPTADDDVSLGGLPVSQSCISGQNVIDYSRSLGGLKTIKKVSINYTASANVGQNNLVQFGTASIPPITRGTFNTLAGTHTVEFDFNGSVVAENIRVYMYGDFAGCTETITLNSVDVTFVGEGNWQEIFDFTQAMGGWEARDIGGTYPPGALYVSGAGWSSPEPASGGPGVYYRDPNIEINFDERTVTRIIVYYNITRGNRDAINPDQIKSPVGTALFNGSDSANGDLVMDWIGSAALTFILVRLDVSNKSNLVDVSGNAVISKVIVEGLGDNPFR